MSSTRRIDQQQPYDLEDECSVSSPRESDVSDLVRLDVLLTLFSGDPDRWLEQVDQTDCDSPELSEDIEFLLRAKTALRANHRLRDRVADLVTEIREILHCLRTATN